MLEQTHRITLAAVATLIILQVVMLAALFAGTRPHPPEIIPLFGIAPFLAVSLSAAASAIVFRVTATNTGRVFCVLAALLALLSFGPQKYLDPQLGLIWPAVVVAQLAAIVLIYKAFRPHLSQSGSSSGA
ncbi:MAG: hypothetical protein ACR2O3_00560 [Rhizobiaceae bacterium]